MCDLRFAISHRTSLDELYEDRNNAIANRKSKFANVFYQALYHPLTQAVLTER
jgi:hypothetical protein